MFIMILTILIMMFITIVSLIIIIVAKVKYFRSSAREEVSVRDVQQCSEACHLVILIIIIIFFHLLILIIIFTDFLFRFL